MSNPMASARPDDIARISIRTCDSYEEAQRAVDFLSDHEFAVGGVQIVGSDLRLVETVTGRMSYGRAAGGGLFGGAWFGLLIGMLLALFGSPDQSPGGATLVFIGLLWGAVFGIIYGLLTHAATRGRRDFSSRSNLLASAYEVSCPVASAEQARVLLAEMRAN